MTSASSMYEAGHSKLVLWDNPEGWGEGDRKEGQDLGTRASVGDSYRCMAKPTKYCKEIILQLKEFN